MSNRSSLNEISIRNLGIIEESQLEFGPGLNVVTGETGAGKTMILTALNLVLGEKSDSSLVRHGSDRLVATAVFSLPKVSDVLSEILESADVAIDDGEIILSRSVTAEAKSKATANGTTVPASLLSAVTDTLIEIHGQSANQQILKSSHQREILDRFAGSELAEDLAKYQSLYAKYHDLKSRISAMKKASAARDNEIQSLKEFLQAWSSLKAVRNEVSTTNDEISRLSSVEDLRSASTGSHQAISDEESGALTALGAAIRFLGTAKGRDSRLDEISERINESFYILDEASKDLSSYLTSLEADPARLDSLQERKSSLLTFLKKWGSGGEPDDELVALAAKAKSGKEDLADLVGGDNRIAELEKELTSVRADLLNAAKTLTKIRLASATKLSQLVTTEIQQLSMPHTSFHVNVEPIDYEGQLKESDFTPTGCDEISLVIQAHPDAPKIAIGKGVSGGEMSRIMLALSVVIAKTYPLGTYIFDEVDAGVGGKAAIEVGRRLHLLAEEAQVIVVTHLPQVAAWADTHFKVEKASDGLVVASGVTLLSETDRVDEIARMLAGLQESASAREHAAELLAMRG